MRCALTGRDHAIVTADAITRHPGMIKHRTYPGGGDMAGLTRCRRWNMGCAHAGGDDAIVTGLASAVDLRMIHDGHWNPARWCVTGVTLIGGIDVRCGFARRNDGVMTTLTGATDFIVIHGGYGNPARIDVAGLAQIRCVDMRRSPAAFARGDGAVVTGDASIRGGGVIEGTHKPHGGDMADVASFDGGHVTDPFANRDHAVMTTFASAGDMRMIHANGRYPCGAVVASLAHLSRGDVAQSFADGYRAIMTTNTGRSRGAVIKDRHQPGISEVTGLARLRGRNVRSTHANSNHPIVAAFACAQHFGMIHCDYRQPGCRYVTGVTLIGGIEMGIGLADGDDTIVTTLASAAGFVVIHHSSGYPCG